MRLLPRLSGLLLAGVLAFVPTSAGAQSPAPATSPSLSEDDDRALRELLQRYYQAFAREELAGFDALWHPQGPARYSRNVFEMEFELRDYTLVGLVVRDVGVDAGGGRARAIVDFGLLDRKTRKERRERRVRDLTFLKDAEGHWRIWNEAAAASRLALRLLNVPADQRAALIDAEPELLSDDAITGLGIRASSARTEGRIGEALEISRLAATLARRLGSLESLGRSQLDAGLVLQVTGRVEEAEQNFAEARDAFASVGHEESVAACDVSLGNSRYLLGRYEQALESFDRALAYYEARSDQARVASVLHGIGNARYMQGDFERALETYSRALGILTTFGDARGAASLEYAAGLVHKELGNYTQAAEAYERSATLSRSADDLVGTAKALHAGGEIHRLLGDFGHALQFFSNSLADWDKTLDVANKATTLFSIGQVYAQQGRVSKAIEWYTKALTTDREAKSAAGEARDLGGLGGAHFVSGAPDAARDHYQRSLAIYRTLNEVPRVLWTLVHLGVLHESQGRHEEALAAYAESLGLAERLGDRPAAATIHALRAAALSSNKDPQSALESVAKAIEIAATLPRLDVIAFANLVGGRIHRAAGDLDAARRSFQAAVEAVERTPVGPEVETFFDDRRGPYLALMDLDAEQQKLPEAVSWAERSRQRLLATLLGGDGAIVTKGMTDEERAEERRFMREVKRAAIRLSRERQRQAPSAERVEELSRALSAAAAERDAFRQRLFASHPDLRWQRGQGDVPTLDALALALADARTAVLDCALAEKRLHLFVVRRTNAESPPVVRHATVNLDETDLWNALSRFRITVASGDEQDATKGARELYDILLAPIATSLSGVSHLVILPDAGLWNLPFEALQSPAGRFLIEDMAVSYAPNLTFFVRAAGTAATRPARLVAFENPALPQDAWDRLALAGVTRPAERGTPATARTQGPGLVFGPARTQRFTGGAATLTSLAEAKVSDSALHLDLPVVFADGGALYSTLTFAPANGQPADTAFVETADLFSWTLPAAAVLLPRAVTSASPAGHSVIAMSWALAVAGTPRLVVTRWSGNERRGGGLWTAFYRAWQAPAKAGASTGVATAMQRAMRRVIAQPASRHPRLWAGAMVIGR